jgi:Bacteriophage Mu Gam like protein
MHTDDDNLDEPADQIRGDDLTKADWHLRAIIRAEDNFARDRAVFDAEILRLTDRLEYLEVRTAKLIEWHETPLRQLHAALLAEDPTRKTIELPHGTLRSRTPATPRYIIESRDRFVEWALVNAPDVLTATWKVDSATIRNDPRFIPTRFELEPDERVQLVTVDGEVVPGVKFVLDPPTFTVTTAGQDPF